MKPVVPLFRISDGFPLHSEWNQEHPHFPQGSFRSGPLCTRCSSMSQFLKPTKLCLPEMLLICCSHLIEYSSPDPSHGWFLSIPQFWLKMSPPPGILFWPPFQKKSSRHFSMSTLFGFPWNRWDPVLILYLLVYFLASVCTFPEAGTRHSLTHHGSSGMHWLSAWLSACSHSHLFPGWAALHLSGGPDSQDNPWESSAFQLHRPSLQLLRLQCHLDEGQRRASCLGSAPSDW